jgi:ribosomal protein S18 acetylase RimI-like enzyme
MSQAGVLRFEPRPLDSPEALAFVDAIQRFYVEVYGDEDDDSTDPHEFAPPRGMFVIGYLDDQPVACGGWRTHDDQTVEIKRMWVAPEARRRGVARRLLAELERTASVSGHRRVVLTTGEPQQAAIAFYTANGYLRSDARFGHYEQFADALFFTKTIR